MDKKLLVIFLVTFFLLTGFSFTPIDINVDEIIVNTEELPVYTAILKQDTRKNNSDSIIMEGISTVLTTIEILKDVVEQSPVKSKEIIKRGKELDEAWDIIETQVEDTYPEDYIDIEESLYPLIDGAQSEKPDIGVLKERIDEVNDKLFKFKEKLAT